MIASGLHAGNGTLATIALVLFIVIACVWLFGRFHH